MTAVFKRRCIFSSLLEFNLERLIEITFPWIQFSVFYCRFSRDSVYINNPGVDFIPRKDKTIETCHIHLSEMWLYCQSIMRNYPGYIMNSVLTRVQQLSHHTWFELAMKALIVNAWPKLTILRYSSFGITFAASITTTIPWFKQQIINNYWTRSSKIS